MEEALILMKRYNTVLILNINHLNATIPEEKDPTELTMEEALILIEKRKEYDKTKKIKKKEIKMNYDEKLKELKIKLPEAKPPVGNYVATKISGKMLFVSGQISIDENGQY